MHASRTLTIASEPADRTIGIAAVSCSPLHRLLPGRSALLALALAVAIEGAYAADGDLDTTWAGGGLVTFSVDPVHGNNLISQLIRESNGNLLVGGSAGGTWFLGERHADGTPVASFGANDGSGTVTGCSLAAALCLANFSAMALQGDGRIVVLDQNLLSRTTAGAHALDTAGVAGSTGYVPSLGYTINSAGGNLSFSKALAQTSLGDWLIAGAGVNTSATSNRDFMATRFGSDFAIDNTFNYVLVGAIQYAGGQDVAFDLVANGQDISQQVIVEPDGHILLVGNAQGGTYGSVLAVARLNSDGTPDLSYGGGTGKATLDSAQGQLGGVQPNATLLDSAGRLVIATSGILVGHTEQRIAVTRLQADGSLDLNFYTSFQIPPLCLDATPDAVTEDSAGRVLVSGVCSYSDGGQFVVARLHGDDGSLDTTFGNSGFSIGKFDAGSTNDEAYDIKLDSSGRPVIAGTSQVYALDGMARLEYDLIFTNSFEVTPRGRLPGQ